MDGDKRPSRGMGMPVSMLWLGEVYEVDGEAALYGRYDFVRRTVNSVSIKGVHSIDADYWENEQNE
jgi:hypothetical protein